MKMKRFLTSLLAGIMLICFLFSLCGCFAQRSEEEIARAEILRLTGVEVPKNTKMVYHFYRDGFQCFSRYEVFEFENEPTEWLNENAFFMEKNEDFEWDFNRFYESDKLPIPEQYQVDFSKVYWGFEKETCFLIFLPNELMLIAYLCVI